MPESCSVFVGSLSALLRAEICQAAFTSAGLGVSKTRGGAQQSKKLFVSREFWGLPHWEDLWFFQHSFWLLASSVVP